MASFNHSRMSAFVNEGQLPIWVVPRKVGTNPARFFHDHNYSEIAIITAGTATHILEGKKAALPTGDVVIIHPGVIHGYDDTENMEIVNLVYDPASLSLPMLDGYTLPLFKMIFPDHNDVQSTVEAVAHLERHDLADVVHLLSQLEDELKNFQSGNALLSMAKFIEVVVFLARKSGTEKIRKQSNFMIGEAVRYMNRHFAEPLRLKTLARLSHMSERNLSRSFHSSVGCSPVEYLLKIRLQHVSDLLINSDYPISEIAGKCGFYDSNYLCKKFRDVFGTTPRQFRLKNRKKNN